MADKSIYDYCLTEENTYKAGPGVPITGDWVWRMYDHCSYSLLMKNGQFPLTQTKWGQRPKKNIIRPILNVAYRSEGFDVKDIEPYVNDSENYHKSFFVRKFHPKWARDNDLDTFIDEVVESYVDYGGVLVKNVNDTRPEVVPMQQIAFCDQTDILSGTIALKHSYSVDQLKDMEKQGWYKEEIDQAIVQARTEKENIQTMSQESDVPDKHIEVYEIHGTFPETWLSKGDDVADQDLDGDKYSKQLHIVTYLKGANDLKTGICLFKGPEPKSIFKFLGRDKIYGRALGYGGVEELFEPQIWTDNNMIRMQKMLEEASKVFYQTADTGYTTRNNTKNIKGGEVFVHDDGKPATPVNNQPINFNLFDRATAEWEQHARVTGSASDPQLGLNPVSGTPLGTTQIVTTQGVGIHEYRRGKIATFIAEIYRDWILSYLVKEMNKGDKWLEELSLEELREIAEKISIKESNQRIKEAVLNGGVVTPEEQDLMRQIIKDEFLKGGKMRFLEMVKGELKDIPIDVFVNVAGKQVDLSRVADKMSNIWRGIFANPAGFVATMNIPQAATAFNNMLEASGMSPIDYTNFPSAESVSASMTPQQPIESPIQQPVTA